MKNIEIYSTDELVEELLERYDKQKKALVIARESNNSFNIGCCGASNALTQMMAEVNLRMLKVLGL